MSATSSPAGRVARAGSFVVPRRLRARPARLERHRHPAACGPVVFSQPLALTLRDLILTALLRSEHRRAHGAQVEHASSAPVRLQRARDRPAVRRGVGEGAEVEHSATKHAAQRLAIKCIVAAHIAGHHVAVQSRLLYRRWRGARSVFGGAPGGAAAAGSARISAGKQLLQANCSAKYCSSIQTCPQSMASTSFRWFKWKRPLQPLHSDDMRGSATSPHTTHVYVAGRSSVVMITLRP